VTSTGATGGHRLITMIGRLANAIPLVNERVFDVPGTTTPLPTGGSACTVLIGGAGALALLFEAAGAADASARAQLLASPDLHHHLGRIISQAPAHVFDAALLDVHPFWLVVAVTVLEHATISSVDPRPGSIGGYPLPTILAAARQLASTAPPFDRLMPCLDLITREERCPHAH
jgi:hypothetical protein